MVLQYSSLHHRRKSTCVPRRNAVARVLKKMFVIPKRKNRERRKARERAKAKVVIAAQKKRKVKARAKVVIAAQKKSVVKAKERVRAKVNDKSN